MEEAGGAAIETTVELVQTDAGAGVVSALCTMLVCLVKPVRDIWKDLSGKTKIKIFMAIGTIIGLFDTILDMIVVVEWFQDDSVWDAIPITIVICIVIPGCVAGLIVRDNREGYPHIIDRSSYSCCANLLIFLLCFIGFGSSVISILTWNELNGKKLVTYQVVRMFEIFIESVPAGALQLYILIRDGAHDLNLNTISIIGSILSLYVGIEEAICKYLSLFDRIIFGIFSLSDFLFRSVTTSFFMKQFALAQWIVVPCIYAFEIILVVYSRRADSLVSIICEFPCAFPCAIPAISSSVIVIYLSATKNFEMTYCGKTSDNVPPMVEIFCRLILGIFFAIFSLLNEWEPVIAFTIMISGTFSMVSSIRIFYMLLYEDPQFKILNIEALEKRLEVHAAEKQQTKRAPTTS